MRISTSQLNRDTIAQIQDRAAAVGRASQQVSTGLKAERFEDLATDLTQLLNLEDVKLNTATYQKNIATAQGRLRASEQALNTIQDIAIQARTLGLSGANPNSAEVRASLAPTVEGYLKNFDALLNSTFEGRYLFSGQAATIAPINTLSAPQTPAPYPGAGPSSAYYQGDQERLKIISSANVTFEYGLTADEPAFAQIRAGLQALWYGLQNNDTTEINSGIQALQASQSALGGLFGELGGSQAGLDLIAARHDENEDFLQERITGLKEVDVTEAISRFTEEQNAFQASLLVLSRLNQVRLIDYL